MRPFAEQDTVTRMRSSGEVIHHACAAALTGVVSASRGTSDGLTADPRTWPVRRHDAGVRGGCPVRHWARRS